MGALVSPQGPGWVPFDNLMMRAELGTNSRQSGEEGWSSQ